MIIMKSMRSFLLFLTLLWSSATWANNVQISNVSIVNTGPGNIQIQFDLAWENSWRINTGQNNYDGVWVFFKYKNVTGDWVHMNLTGSNNVLPSGFDVFQNSGSNKVGAMISRSAGNLGIGNAAASGILLGVTNTLPYNIDVKGFAIEMVYVPAPTSRVFFGDGDGTNESINAFHYIDNTATTSSVLPMLADANALDNAELETDGIYVYSNDTIQTTNPIGTLDPFPTMKAFWCMKYELTQGAYRDFLNTLDSTQQATRTSNPPSSPTGTYAMSGGGINRSFLEISTPASVGIPAVYGCDANGNNVYNESADGEWVACNYINWQDMAAYLDWSGLAPMSEFQFERACRGTSSAGANPAILGEYAWGTNTIFGSSYSLTGSASAAESASNASASLGNAAYSSTYSVGPLRNGIFATGTSNRATSGASFYGIMEMTGNLAEYVIHFGSVAGRSCKFVPNGNGVISPNGNAQLSVGGAGFWPGMEGNSNMNTANTCSGTCEITGLNTGSAGIRLRGGSINDAASSLSLADRSATFTPTARAGNRGGRGVLYVR